jgi:glycosyltransferase involved in cell wall biosynthesis
VQDLKISLITVVYNAETTIGRCIESVISQNFKNVEYIIIDACSTDKTKQL